MSGHFILLNIDHTELASAKRKNATWSALQHYPKPGWNTESRSVLMKALRGESIKNRNGLPPHRYLECGVKNKVTLHQLFQSAVWATTSRLSRPASQGLGLKELHSEAREAWAKGEVRKALALQFDKGHDVTFEIYYLQSLEMT